MSNTKWAVLLYLCGDTPAMHAGIKADRDEALRAKLNGNLSLAIQVDLPYPDGAKRYLRRPGQDDEVEDLRATDSGSDATLRDFLTWGLREFPADHVALVFGGTGIFDPNSVVGLPDHNWTDVFAICDDAPARNALEIAKLRDVLESVLDELGIDRIGIVAFDMCRMQFLEVAYELETVAELVIAAQTAVPASGWNYQELLESWDDVATPKEQEPDGAVSSDSLEEVARRVVKVAVESYSSGGGDIVVSALDLRRLDDIARDFDGFTVAYMQALGDWMAWEARKAVAAARVEDHSYDLREALAAIERELTTRARQSFERWLGYVLSNADSRRRVEYATALERAMLRQRSAATGEPAKVIDHCLDALCDVRKLSRSRPSAAKLPPVELPPGTLSSTRDAWEACFAGATQLPVKLQEEYAVLQQERERARYLSMLANRVLRHFPAPDADSGGLIVARASRVTRTDYLPCGVSLYRPTDLGRLADSNYLKLEFTRRVHWAALLAATNLIDRDQRALWRIISSMLGSADSRGREDLVNRLVGTSSVATSYRGQFRALAPSPVVTLSLEPMENGSPRSGKALTDTYRLRLESARRDATLKQNETRVNPSTIESSLSGLEDLLKQRWIDSEDMERVESLGRTLGEDIVQDLDPSLAAELALAGDRDLHMQLQIPPPLMRYPWELMHDGQAWLSERYALGRQVFMEQSAVRWAARRRCGGLRVLIIGDPLLQGVKGHQQLPGARDEAEHVASLFERLQDQIGVSMDFDRRRDVRIHQVLTRDECRRILRSGAYDIIHFAGHAFFDRDDPLRSGWILSDGALWAQEIRNTLMRTTPPWLVYANACEAAMDAQGPAAKYQGDVYGLASAFINKGVSAYIAPLWPIDDGMAMKIAADFYTLLALDRMTIGEALCHAKRRAKTAVLGNGNSAESLVTVPAYMGLSWASLILYGDPTQTLVQQLAARSEIGVTTALATPTPDAARTTRRRRRTPLHGEAPLQAAPSALTDFVTGPGMRPLDRMRGPEQLGPAEQDLVVVEEGGIRYWATIKDGVREPLEPAMAHIAGKAQEKLSRDRGFTDYVRIVGRWATGRLEGSLIGEIARQYDQNVVSSEGLLVRDPFSGQLRPFGKSDETPSLVNSQTESCLLLIHGTFSNSARPVDGLGNAFFDWAHRRYRQVLAFDHWTLSKSPLENAQMLWQQLPAWTKQGERRIDIITHSRGGLVARALVELSIDPNIPPAAVAKTVGHVIFVGTPNFGTSLADPANWGRAADLLINLVHVDAIGLYGKLSGLLARLALSRLGAEVLSQIPGLQAQNPRARQKGQFLGDLLAVQPPSGIRFAAVSTNYEPRRDEAHLKLIAKLAGDEAADNFFNGFNDLVVNTRNVWIDTDLSANGSARLIKPENLLLFTPPDSGLEDTGSQMEGLYGVHHTNLFETEKTRSFIVKQLRS